MKRLFIINPSAGGGRGLARWREFSKKLRVDGTSGDEVVTTRPGEAIEIARQAAGERDLVVAVGGDGTVFEVLSGLLHDGPAQPALAIVPLGTGNDAAVASGTGTLEKARRALRNGTTRAVDAIRIDCLVNGRPGRRHAMLFAAAGITSEALRRTTGAVKRLFGPRLAYPVGVFRAVWSYRAPVMKIGRDGRSEEGRYLLVAACNAERVGGGMRLAPGARTDDGMLNLNLVNSLGPWQAVWQIRRVGQGRHLDHPQVRYVPVRVVTIDAEPSIGVEADGDTIGETPARFEVMPGAVSLVVGG
jgi:YegS/Rv2252/BmrU family lipid kinase